MPWCSRRSSRTGSMRVSSSIGGTALGDLRGGWARQLWQVALLEELRHVVEVVDVVVVGPVVAVHRQVREIGAEVLAEDRPERIDRAERGRQTAFEPRQIQRVQHAEPRRGVLDALLRAVDTAAEQRTLIGLDD